MSQKGQTKDERFLIALYDAAMEKGDVYHPVNRFDIGDSLGLQSKAINVICRDLLQCNFIKKAEDDDVCLTKHGLNLVDELSEE